MIFSSLLYLFENAGWILLLSSALLSPCVLGSCSGCQSRVFWLQLTLVQVRAVEIKLDIDQIVTVRYRGTYLSLLAFLSGHVEQVFGKVLLWFQRFSLECLGQGLGKY